MQELFEAYERARLNNDEDILVEALDDFAATCKTEMDFIQVIVALDCPTAKVEAFEILTVAHRYAYRNAFYTGQFSTAAENVRGTIERRWKRATKPE